MCFSCLSRCRSTLRRLLKRPSPVVALITLLFVAWAAVFIYNTSFVAVTGERTFCLFDDAMISMRYAWNLAHGEGLVWNPGDRTEGFTNLGMTLYMAVASLFLNKSAAVTAVQISGIPVLLVLATLCMQLGRAALVQRGIDVESRPARRILLPLFFCAGLAYYPLHYWTLMGMENGLQILFLSAGMLGALRRDKDPRFSPCIPLFLGLAYITRPDSAVAAACIMTFRLSGIFRLSGGLRSMVKEFAVLAGIVLAVALFRLGYYGEWTPNTYTLKVVGHPFSARLLSGSRYVKLFWWNVNLIVPAVAVAGCFFRPSRFKLLLLSILVTTGAYQIYVGGDAFAHFRMMAHYIPILLLLLLLGVTDILAPLTHRLSLSRVATASVIFIGAAWILNLDYRSELSFNKGILDVGNNRRHVNLAFRLNEVLNEDASVAVFYAGAIPYYTGLRAVDLLGKCDKHVASGESHLPNMKNPARRYAPGHTKYDLAYSVQWLEPTYTAGIAWRGQNLSEWGEQNYRLVTYKRTKMRLKKDSDAVRWDRINGHN